MSKWINVRVMSIKDYAVELEDSQEWSDAEDVIANSLLGEDWDDISATGTLREKQLNSYDKDKTYPL